MTVSTAAERATWKALAEDAEDGPWEAVEGASGGWWVERRNTATICHIDVDYSGNPDAAFIAAARTAVPALLADVERLERELHICGLARDLANEESIQLEAENARLREADL